MDDGKSDLTRLTGRIVSAYVANNALSAADLPKMVDLYLDGKLKVDEMVSRYYRLDEINTAYDALANGEVARSVINFN